VRSRRTMQHRGRHILLPHVSIPLDGSSLCCALLRSKNIPSTVLPLRPARNVPRAGPRYGGSSSVVEAERSRDSEALRLLEPAMRAMSIRLEKQSGNRPYDGLLRPSLAPRLDHAHGQKALEIIELAVP